MKRRDFLKNSMTGAFLILAHPALQGCNRSTPEPTTTPTTPSTPVSPSASEPGPYPVWREVQSALRSSPDHPVGRAEQLVSKNDLKALHQFVRDEIRLISAQVDRFAFGNVVKWGPRAALRAGAGTAREKAELFVSLVQKTGRKAEIVELSEVAKEKASSCFFRSIRSDFAPSYSKEQFADWIARLNLRDMASVTATEIDPEGSQNIELTQTLLACLKSSTRPIGNEKFDQRTVGRLPVVKITEPDGSVVYADVVSPDGPLAAAPENAQERAAAPISEVTPVTVTVLASTADPNQAPLELVSGSWPMTELAGRQLRIGFQPAVELNHLSVSRFTDLRNFIPGLALQALDEPEALSNIVAGEAFNIGGDRLKVEPDGSVTINGSPLVGPGEHLTADHVKSLVVKADASRFPEVRLSVTATDEAEKNVEGLPASAFVLKDQGEPFGFELLSNRAAPRVLILADQSMSMPKAFRGGHSSMEELIERIRKFVKSLHPDAEVVSKTTNSNLWEELAIASGSTSTLIIYATDGDLDGRRPDQAMYETLRQGPPALLLDVNGKLDTLRAKKPDNLFDEMAKATNGWAYPVPDLSLDKAEVIIEKILREKAPLTPYVFRYTAATSSDMTHTVELVASSASGTTTYEVPKEPSLPRQLTSLHLQIEVGGHKVSRRLAGYPGKGELVQEHLDEVRGALFGLHLLAFEGPLPSPSVVLDDILQAKLQLETLDKATADSENKEGFEQALAAGFPVLPGELATLLIRSQPESGEDYSFTANGLRTVLYSAHAVLNSQRFVKRVDILPLEFATAISTGPERTRELNVSRSMELALAEAAMFEESTIKALKGKSLGEIPRRPFRDIGLPPEKVDAWNDLIEKLRSDYPHPGALFMGDTSGAELALWAVNLKSGEVLGVLPDGSGGGQTEIHLQETISQLDKVVSGLNLLATAAGAAGAVGPMGGVALGIVGAYGQQLARLYAAVSAVLLAMDIAGLDEALRKSIATMVCEVVKNIALGGFSSAGKSAEKLVNNFATFEGTVGLAGGSSPFSCP